MDSFLFFYQHLPLYLNPAFEIGFFSISWYSIMYLIGFAVVYYLLLYRIRKKESFSGFSGLKIKNIIIDFLLYVFFGLLIGARLGHVFFYKLLFFMENPLAVISPFDSNTHEFIGIYGMSYHGGLIGVLIASLIFVRRYRIDFWALSDFIVPAVPAGYFFGRVGNFINNELYGKITEDSWGMYFKDYPLELRHPSQLYEALLEGVVLFIILWTSRNKKNIKKNFLALYIIGYGVTRFICEFFREPDKVIGFLSGHITLGQLFSAIMTLFGIFIIAWKRKNWYN